MTTQIHTNPDLFSLHGEVSAKGPRGAVAQASRSDWPSQPKAPSLAQRALGERNGRRVADSASKALIREHSKEYDLGYTYSAWCLAGLPHRDHPAGEDWVISTDYAQLLVRPGVRISDDGTREALAVPSGTMARLLLIELQSQALEKGTRDVEIGENPNVLIERMGLSRGGPVSRKLADQIERLCRCTLDFKIGTDRRGLIVNERLVEAFEYSGEEDKRSKRLVPMVQRLRLSEAFFSELLRHPIPIDRAAIKSIQSSPRAIDIYLWLAFRLHALEGEVQVSWPVLWRQFGRERLLRTFRAEFREPLALALSAYKEARVSIADHGLVLLPSPPPVTCPA